MYRQDVARGERWRVHLPDGPPLSSGLLLRQPKSLLFVAHSRQDRQTPTGEPYLFLAVDWGAEETGKRFWVFSTDPVQRLSLRPLAERLSQAESALDLATPPGNTSWYDGRDSDYTMVAPPRGGTRLPADEVLRLVKEWAGAAESPATAIEAALSKDGKSVVSPKRARPRRHRWFVGAVALLVLLGVTGAVVWRHRDRGTERDPWRSVAPFYSIKQRITGAAPARFALWNRTGHEQRVRLQVRLEVDREKPPANVGPLEVRVVVNPDGTKEKAHKVTATAKGDGIEVPLIHAVLAEGANTVEVRVSEKAGMLRAVQLSCWEKEGAIANLYVLAVGVSKYAHPPEAAGLDAVRDLKFADNDAEELVAELQAQEGKLFHKVACRKLLNEKASRDNIVNGFAWLHSCVHDDAGDVDYRLAIVALSGHGERHPQLSSKQFFFLPYDFNEKPDRPFDNRGVASNQIRDYLSDLGCPVILLLDACHSGGFAFGPMDSGQRGAADPEAIKEAMQGLGRTKNGIIVIAACLGEEKAREYQDLKHGLLSYTFLECIRGQKRPNAEQKIIFLSELHEHMNRIPRSKTQGQAFVIQPLNGISLNTIPLAVAPGD